MAKKKLAPGWYVVIYESLARGESEAKRLGPYVEERQACKADAGANRNLNHEKFFTRIEGGRMTLLELRRMAAKAAEELDGRHGDPAKNANWTRERRLAGLVVQLVDRIQGAASELFEEPR